MRRFRLESKVEKERRRQEGEPMAATRGANLGRAEGKGRRGWDRSSVDIADTSFSRCHWTISS